MTRMLQATPNKRLIIKNLNGKFSDIVTRVQDLDLETFATSSIREVISVKAVSATQLQRLTEIGATVQLESRDISLWTASPY